MTDRRTKHYHKLQAEYEDAIKVVEAKQGERLRNYRKKLAENNCPHPAIISFRDPTQCQCQVCWKVLDKKRVGE